VRAALLTAELSAVPVRSVPAFRWLGIVATATVTGNQVRMPRAVLPELAQRCVGRPVRARLDGAAFVHPRKQADPDDPAARVGVIEQAWATAWAVQAVVTLDPDAARLQRALARMHAAGRLRWLLGLSLHYVPTWAPGPALVVTGIETVRAVDIVSAPADSAARLVRPLGAEEFTRHGPTLGDPR
jgi:hypothetical protein